MSTPSGILVVDDDVAALGGLLALLRNFGYRTTGAADVSAGCAFLEAFPFDVLITDIRLHRESGLSLIRRAREIQPGIAIVAVTGYPDEAIEREITRLNATYMLKPIDVARLKQILDRSVSGGAKQRRWRRKPVPGGFGATVGDSVAKVVDMSYGGLRLEMPSPPQNAFPPNIRVNLLPFGFAVNAKPVWSDRPTPEGEWRCGAALSEMDASAARAWRVVVDVLPEATQGR